jgi:hypothetical protein
MVAVFNIGDFIARYPEFTAVNTANPARLPALFQDAGTLYLNNTGLLPRGERREAYLAALYAHGASILAERRSHGRRAA